MEPVELTTPSRRPTVVIEANIPFAHGLLEPYANVIYADPGDITPELMTRANALITRTRTKCNEALLSNSPCTIIASATIGLDHVDKAYCSAHGIEVCNAPGCNASAVAQYVISSIISLYGQNLSGLTLGVVGVGHVGSIIVRWAESLGMKVMMCDPPRSRREPTTSFHTLSALAEECDIITFHTPLTHSGPDATFHLANETFFSQLRKQPTIINSARGPITHTDALVKALREGIVRHAVIDCWENEPDISTILLNLATIATPHIAGYSLQGKIRATQMAVAAVARHFSWPEPTMSVTTPKAPPAIVTAGEVAASYSPLIDTAALRRDPAAFEQLRNHYNLRNEVSA